MVLSMQAESARTRIACTLRTRMRGMELPLSMLDDKSLPNRCQIAAESLPNRWRQQGGLSAGVELQEAWDEMAFL